MSTVLITFLGLVYLSNAYILSGYLCPTCPSAPDPNTLISSINAAYTRVNIAFIGWNSDGTIINQFDDPSKSFILTKAMVSALQSKGVDVFISIGGGAGGTLACSDSSNTAFIKNYVDGIMNITTEYGFDGVDFDIEHRSGDFVQCADLIATVMNTLNQNKLQVTIAPQMVNVYPGLSTVSPGFNELAPLIAMETPQVLESVQVQMYNSWSSVETTAYAETYTKQLAAGYNVTADGKPYFVKVPPSQLVLGYPASPKGAGSGYIAPSQLKTMYASLKSAGYTVSGFMTWSIGWDEQNNWDFANTLGNL
eukprot:CAMPEP_0201580462 /NCGR_PEP_ID=MMETSP0190_2-20130828/46535_1 /ASSEMBLY_ACC=CAM_ASM_000263 /TAXON_ID=37353 /ORGANISM="Rosalina sp." /LENGTH=307 /DNA_ID=CAMNT_0048016545 /DNA_START=30 /DNA_END=953 /DNA_ORIENTATION=+